MGKNINGNGIGCCNAPLGITLSDNYYLNTFGFNKAKNNWKQR